MVGVKWQKIEFPRGLDIRLPETLPLRERIIPGPLRGDDEGSWPDILPIMSSGPHHTYRGHRRQSFVAQDVNELVELRARQRTFHGAYSRTAIGALGYAITILRLFDRDFYRIGLLFAILGALLFILAFFRARHSAHDFADRSKEAASVDEGIQTVGQDTSRIYGRPFVTAGWIVLQVSAVVAAVEIGMLILILRRDAP